MALLSNNKLIQKNIIRRRSLSMILLIALLALSALSALSIVQPFSISRLTQTAFVSSAHAATNSTTNFAIQNSVQNQPPPGCSELVKNGDFETLGPEWELNRGARPPMHVSDITHDNSEKSMQLGIVNLANAESSSFVRQTVNLPTGVESIVLTFYYYTRGNPSPDADVQFVEVFNNLTGTFLTRVLTEQSNTGDWVTKQYNLTPYSGQQVNIYFAVENDGGSGSLAMNVDDVSILACNPLVPATDTPTSTPTATPTPTLTPTIDTSVETATPQPTTNTATTVPPTVVNSGNCQNYLDNGNFEVGNAYFDTASSWQRGKDPVQAQLTNTEKYSGNYSALLGNPPNNGEGNKQTYSSIRQLVAIPSGIAQLELRWRHLTKSGEAANSNPDRTSDRADVILLDPELTPLEVVHRHRNKPTTWKIESESISIANYSGRNFYVYFNVYNDGNGGRTWSFVDDIELIGCQTSAVLPSPAAAVAAATEAPAATKAPAATPVPTQKADPTTANQATPTKTATQTIVDPPVAQVAQPQSTVAQDDDPMIMSSETEPIQDYSVTPIQAAKGLQVPTTLPTYAPEGNSSSLLRRLFSSSDPDPQPTNTFQWLQMLTSCGLVMGVFLVLALAFINREKIPGVRRLFLR